MLKKIASVVAVGALGLTLAAGPAFAKFPTRTATALTAPDGQHAAAPRSYATIKWNGHKWAGKIRLEGGSLQPGTYTYVVQMTNRDLSNSSDRICTFKIFRADKAGGCAGKSTNLFHGTFGDEHNTAEVYLSPNGPRVLSGEMTDTPLPR